MTTQPQDAMAQVDLAIVTALSAELEPVLNLVGGREQWRKAPLDGFMHYFGQFPCDPRPFRVVACALWKYGGTATAVQVQRLKALQPRLIAMTGICAGRQDKGIRLGDLVVAERAFYAREGGKQTSAGFQPDIRTYGPPSWLVQWLKEFAPDPSWSRTITTARPPSLEYQAEWLLCQLGEHGPAFPATLADWELVKNNGINYPLARQRLQAQKLLTSTGKLSAQAQRRLNELRQQNYGQLRPTPDPAQPQVHINAFASSDAVVAIEQPFHELSQYVRSVGAIEMEVPALFDAAEQLGVPAFAVKGVCDYATPEKDDAFHAYAAEAAARWMYAFVVNHAALLDQQLPARQGAAPQQAHPAAGNTTIGGNVGTNQSVILTNSTVEGSIIGSQQNVGAPPAVPSNSSAPSPEEVREQQERLYLHRRTLASYLSRLAILGSAYATPEISHGIRETRANIQQCKRTLRNWGEVVEDGPDDDPHP